MPVIKWLQSRITYLLLSIKTIISTSPLITGGTHQMEITMNVTYTQKGNTDMFSKSNKTNAFSDESGKFNHPGKPQFGGCALVLVLAVVAIILFTVVIPALAR